MAQPGNEVEHLGNVMEELHETMFNVRFGQTASSSGSSSTSNEIRRTAASNQHIGAGNNPSVAAIKTKKNITRSSVDTVEKKSKNNLCNRSSI